MHTFRAHRIAGCAFAAVWLAGTLITGCTRAGDGPAAAAAQTLAAYQHQTQAAALTTRTQPAAAQSQQSPIRPTATHTPEPRPEASPVPADSGRIVFVSNRDGNGEIYAVNADGTGLTRLTHDDVDDTAPSWSPDGRYITYVSLRLGGAYLYGMRADGSDVRFLAGPVAGYYPEWSADGTHLIVQVIQNDGVLNARVVSLESSLAKNLGTVQPPYVPVWSPDGSLIAHILPDQAGYPLVIYDANGKEQCRVDARMVSQPMWSSDSQLVAFVTFLDDVKVIGFITRDCSGRYALPCSQDTRELNAWSADNQYIAYISGAAAGMGDIYIISTHYGPPRKVVQSQFPTFPPPQLVYWDLEERTYTILRYSDEQLEMTTYDSHDVPLRQASFPGLLTRTIPSPDGAWLALTDTPATVNAAVYLVHAETLAHWELYDAVQGLDWSPSGQYLSYSANPGGDYEIYVANSDTSSLRNLSNYPQADDTLPRWRPD